MRIAKVKPPYIPLVQMPWHCFPCCMQWVLLRRKLPFYSQEEIGRRVNLRVPKNLKHLFSKKVRYTSNKKLYGAVKAQNYVNKFFKQKKLPLKHEYLYYDEVSDHAQFIAKNIRANKDLIVCFNWRGLGRKKNTGHCCVITGIKLGKRPRVTLGDPVYDHPKFWDVDLKRLIRAMERKYDNIKRGFFVISRR